ncbi:hypothetical protein D3C87_1431010 [compost metagenome]
MLSMQAILLNESTPQMTFVDAKGIELGTFKLPSRIFSAPQDEKTVSLAHWVEAPLDESIGKALGIPMRQASFQEILLNIIVQTTAQSQAHSSDDRDFLDMFTVVRTNKSYVLDPKLDVPTRTLGVTRLVALKDNAFATMSIRAANAYDLLKDLTGDELGKLYHEAQIAEAKAGKDKEVGPYEGSSFSKELQDLSTEQIAAFANDSSNGPLNAYLATILPASNPQ